MTTSSDSNGKGLPTWANEASVEELVDIMDQFDHICEPGIGERGWICVIPGCEAQVQMWDTSWWHVPELIAYSVISGQVEQTEDPPGWAMAVASMHREEEAQIIVMGPRNKPTMATVTTDGLTTQERIDQTIAMWEAANPGGYESWGD